MKTIMAPWQGEKFELTTFMPFNQCISKHKSANIIDISNDYNLKSDTVFFFVIVINDRNVTGDGPEGNFESSIFSFVESLSPSFGFKVPFYYFVFYQAYRHFVDIFRIIFYSFVGFPVYTNVVRCRQAFVDTIVQILTRDIKIAIIRLWNLI